jgi:hypothetical protein
MPAASRIGEVRYVPSFLRERQLPEPGGVEAVRDAPRFPPGKEPPALLAMATPPVSLTAAVVRTARFFSSSLRGRDAAPDAPVTLKPGITSSRVLQPSEFLLAIDERGEVRYLFLQSSSGDREVDRMGERMLAAHPFRRAEGEGSALVWGTATWVWGRELLAAAPAPPSDGKGVAR